MAGRQCGRRNGGRAAGLTAREETAACGENQVQEDMPMCRHVNLTPTTAGCRCVEKQLLELNQVLDYQNKILVELLQAVREQAKGT